MKTFKIQKLEYLGHILKNQEWPGLLQLVLHSKDFGREVLTKEETFGWKLWQHGFEQQLIRRTHVLAILFCDYYFLVSARKFMFKWRAHTRTILILSINISIIYSVKSKQLNNHAHTLEHAYYVHNLYMKPHFYWFCIYTGFILLSESSKALLYQ